MTTDLAEYLKTNLGDKEFIYIPNPGNAGDSLITLGTLQLFRDLELRYRLGTWNSTYTDQYLVYGGGGNLVKLAENLYNSYHTCREFLKNNNGKNHIIILPHTIKNNDETLKMLDENVKIFCREPVSFEYVKGMVKYPENVFMSHDMAMYIRIHPRFMVKGVGACNCFRGDIEKTDIRLPAGNVDLANDLNTLLWQDGVWENVVSFTDMVFEILSKYDVICTNRLHMAIAGGLLGKHVYFYPNSYYKCKAVYEYSLREQFPKITFL